jgi:hypothetical protein
MTARVQLKKEKNDGREAEGSWRQDEMLDDKPPFVK